MGSTTSDAGGNKRLIIRVALNAIFVVCQDRRDEFLVQFPKSCGHAELPPSTGIKTHHHHEEEEELTAGEVITKPTLIQAVLGEDLETPGTFHCHLKFQFEFTESSFSLHSQPSDKKDDNQSIVQDAIQKYYKSNPSQNIFLQGASKEWIDFEATNPFEKDPEVLVWIVAPIVDEKDGSRKIPNPKPFPPKSSSSVFCLNANLYVKPNDRSDFIRFMENARSCSIHEPLCQEYQYGESMHTPNTFHVHQAYTGDNGGKEGFDVHAKTSHYQTWKEFSANDKPFTKSPVGYVFRSSSHNNLPPNYLLENPNNQQETASHSTHDTSNHAGVILLDGGMGHELKQRGVITDDGSFLAGVLANEERPHLVEAVHWDFFKSGCQVITTNSFVAVPQRVRQDIMTASKKSCNGGSTSHDSNSNKMPKIEPSQEAVHERTRALIVAAVKCPKAVAAEAREHGRILQVAGTVPPLTECYMATHVPTDMEQLKNEYIFLLSALMMAEQQQEPTVAAATVDILLAETLSTIREGVALVRAYSQLSSTNANKDKIPLWLSFTIDDFLQPPVLRSGENLKEAVCSILEEADKAGVNLGAIGLNCASPVAITNALPILLSSVKDKSPPPRILAYANAFQTTTSEWLASLQETPTEMSTAKGRNVDQSEGAETLRSPPGDYDSIGIILPAVYTRYAKQWIQMGVSIVGGCCGCSPSHLKAVNCGIKC